MRTRTEAPLTTRNARKGLQPQPKPYLRTIATGVSIGYRKKAKDGLWTATLYLGGGKYREQVIGTADDVQDADGVHVLTFEQARKAVLAKVEEWRADAKAEAAGPIITVASAVKLYVTQMNARELSQDRVRRDTENRMAYYVLADPLADVGLHRLTETDLSEWRARQSVGRSEATVRRISNDLRAALNIAAKKHRATLPADVSIIVKSGLASESHDQPIARDDAALPNEDVRRILDAAAEIDEAHGWDGDLHRLVVVLAATGARFSQVIRIRVGDLQPDRGRLMIPVSRKGKGGKSASHVPVRIGADVVRLLVPATVGRRSTEPLLTRWAKALDGEKFAGWKRTGRTPWRSPTEVRRSWEKIVKRAGLGPEVVPYALRHSSIVRALGAGLPVRLVAAMHDTSTAMIERHYSGSISSMLDDLAGAAVVPLVREKTVDNVIPLRG